MYIFRFNINCKSARLDVNLDCKAAHTVKLHITVDCQTKQLDFNSDCKLHIYIST